MSYIIKKELYDLIEEILYDFIWEDLPNYECK
jgi:hypothetical protein